MIELPDAPVFVLTAVINIKIYVVCAFSKVSEELN